MLARSKPGTSTGAHTSSASTRCRGGAERDPFAGTGSKVEVAAQPGLRLIEPDDLEELLLPGRHGQGGAQIG